MSDKDKDIGVSNPQENLGDGNQNKPQSYGTEVVLKGLNISKPLSYGTERIVQSKSFDSSMEESDE